MLLIIHVIFMSCYAHFSYHVMPYPIQSASTSTPSSEAPVRSCCAGKKSSSSSSFSTERYLTCGLLSLAVVGVGVILYTRYQRSHKQP